MFVCWSVSHTWRSWPWSLVLVDPWGKFYPHFNPRLATLRCCLPWPGSPDGSCLGAQPSMGCRCTLDTLQRSSKSRALRKASVARPVGRESRATGRNNHNFEFLLTKKQEQYLFCSCHWRIGCLQLGAVRELPVAQFQLAGAVERKSRAAERATNQSRRKMRNGAQFKFCSGRVGVRNHGSEGFWS